MIATREQPQWSTNHQRDLSNSSPLALAQSPSNPLTRWNLFHHNLLQQHHPDLTGQTLMVYTAPLPVFITTNSGHLDQVFISNTPLEMSAQPKSPQTGSLKRIYEHNQLFKLRLFADNLLTIQLFILRLRPSPSHKQMKSNKALLTNDTVEPERRRESTHIIL